MYESFTIDSAEKLVEGFAIGIRDGEITLEDVRSLIMDCTEGDERLTTVVLEKTQVRLECMSYLALVS